jgi:uncharacterized protein YdaU (DUF1376 family)
MDKRKKYWFKFNAENWRSSAFVAELTCAARGVYIDLLAAAWLTDDCTLPSDEAKLRRLGRVDDDGVWGVVWPELRGKFRRRNGRLYNEVLSAEFDEMTNRYEASIANGKKGGRKKNLDHNLDGNLDAQIHKRQPTTYIIQATDTKNLKSDPSKRKKPKTGLTDPDFNKFWAKYPRKIGRVNAEKAWLKSATSPEAVAAILDGLSRAVKCRQWLSDGGQFIPHASTWLRREGWNDEYDGRNIAETERMEGLPF